MRKEEKNERESVRKKKGKREKDRGGGNKRKLTQKG